MHSSNFPRIVAPAADGSEVYSFTDSTGANFDNKIVTEYLGNTTTDPMQRGLCTTNKLCADTTVFGQDKNLTMKKLADQNTFASTCATVFQKLVEVVPKTTTLSQTIIIPYEVKPSFQLTLLDGGSQMTFAGEVRVRTTVRSQSQISSVQINYSDRNGGSSCGSCVIMTSMIGTANGFDDSFAVRPFLPLPIVVPILTELYSFIPFQQPLMPPTRYLPSLSRSTSLVAQAKLSTITVEVFLFKIPLCYKRRNHV